ncbi:MAG: type I-E CRISPR-associated protein Cas6/Cse3/CasE [Gammaproteobacteria bacterium]
MLGYQYKKRILTGTKAFTQGIGSAKSFGFGLLLLQPICEFNH